MVTSGSLPLPVSCCRLRPPQKKLTRKTRGKLILPPKECVRALTCYCKLVCDVAIQADHYSVVQALGRVETKTQKPLRRPLFSSIPLRSSFEQSSPCLSTNRGIMICRQRNPSKDGTSHRFFVGANYEAGQSGVLPHLSFGFCRGGSFLDFLFFTKEVRIFGAV